MLVEAMIAIVDRESTEGTSKRWAVLLDSETYNLESIDADLHAECFGHPLNT